MKKALLTAANLVSSHIQQGDAGVVLRSDGSFQIFQTHGPVTPGSMTEEQKMQAGKLLALSVALRSDAIMQHLMYIAMDPAKYDQTNMLAIPKLHS